MSHWDATNLLVFAAGLALKSTAILAMAWAVTAAMRKQSAAARHAVWTAAFAAVLALPVLTAALPGLRAPGLSRVLPSASGPVFRTSVTASAESSGERSGAAAV